MSQWAEPSAQLRFSTQGAPNLDFTLAGGSTCTGDVRAGASCTLNVAFAPRLPGMRTGAVELTDSPGTCWPPLLFTAKARVQPSRSARRPDDGGQRTEWPRRCGSGWGGQCLHRGYPNNRVVKIPAGGGAQTTVGSDLSFPQGVAVDGAGDVFIADGFNNRLVEVLAGGGAQTMVGSGLIAPPVWSGRSAPPVGSGPNTPQVWQWMERAMSSSRIPATTA